MVSGLEAIPAATAGVVLRVMKLHTDYGEFHPQLDQVAPVYPDAPGLFDNAGDWSEPD